MSGISRAQSPTGNTPLHEPISPTKSPASTHSNPGAPIGATEDYNRMGATLRRVSKLTRSSLGTPPPRSPDEVESEASAGGLTKKKFKLDGETSLGVSIFPIPFNIPSPLPLPLPTTGTTTPLQREKYSALSTPPPAPIPLNWGGAETPAPSRKPAPPTPMRRRLSSSTERSPYEVQYSQLRSGLFHYQGKVFQVAFLAKGSFSNVYTFLQSTPAAVAGVDDNSTLVAKAYHGEIGTRFEPNQLNTYLTHSIDNYRAVLSLNLPVATIHNIQTAIADRVIIQDKIPHPVNISYSKQVEQIAKFFEAAVTRSVVMDLQPANLRVDDAGVVKLIDFVEDEDLVLLPAINLACTAWCKLFKENGLNREQARAYLKEFTSSFLDKNENFSSAWLEALLDS